MYTAAVERRGHAPVEHSKKPKDTMNISKENKSGKNKAGFLARDTSSPYIDTAPIENGTQYYAYFVLGDTETGQRSDTVTVSVS